MTLSEAFRAHFQAQGSPVSLITKVRPVLVQNVTTADYPFAVVRRISGSGEVSHDGDQGLNRVRISVSVYDSNYSRCEKIIAGIRSSLAGFNGLLGGSGGVRISIGQFAGPRDVYDEITRSIGQQLDILGLVDEETIS